MPLRALLMTVAALLFLPNCIGDVVEEQIAQLKEDNAQLTQQVSQLTQEATQCKQENVKLKREKTRRDDITQPKEASQRAVQLGSSPAPPGHSGSYALVVDALVASRRRRTSNLRRRRTSNLRRRRTSRRRSSCFMGSSMYQACKTCNQVGGVKQKRCTSCHEGHQLVRKSSLSVNGYCWDGKCSGTCDKCYGVSLLDCTSCPDGAFLMPKQIKINHNGQTVKTGRCADMPAKMDQSAVTCVALTAGVCTDAKIMKPPDSDTTHQLCSRLCLVGGRYTYGRFQRKNEDNTTSPYVQHNSYLSPEFKHYADKYGFSSPVCILYKVVDCEQPPDFDEADCANCKNNEQCREKHCERCKVKKDVRCHAIVPGWSFHDKPITNWTDAQMGECKNSVKPCDSVARYM